MKIEKIEPTTRVTIPCDDDHYALSEIILENDQRGVKGISLEINAPRGKPNFAFLRFVEAEQLIEGLKVLMQLEQNEGGWTYDIGNLSRKRHQAQKRR